jgi:hypothetical protein
MATDTTGSVLDDIKSLLVKVLVEQNKVHSRIAALEKAMDTDRTAEREFLIRVMTLSHQSAIAKASAPLLPSVIEDPFAELPLGDKAGFSYEELGILHDSPKTEE